MSLRLKKRGEKGELFIKCVLVLFMGLVALERALNGSDPTKWKGAGETIEEDEEPTTPGPEKPQFHRRETAETANDDEDGQ
jgi:hypothetical protein